jgi:hypothetical protein
MNARPGQISVLKVAGAGSVAVALVGAGLHFSAGSDGNPVTVGLAAGTTGAVALACPDVAGRLTNVPAQSQAGVTLELTNLVRQIANVNARLAREPGQAANQLNDIAGKRNAVIDRIILDITRVGGAEPAGLRSLAQCSLSTTGSAGVGTTAAPTVTAAPTPAPTIGNGSAQAGAKAKTVNCPAVRGQLPAVPAGATAEVSRNLALLDQQIAEANARLAGIAVHPEGGPNFIQNAILGPLKDKRVATLNRIATAIGRITNDRPSDLANLAPCTLNG